MALPMVIGMRASARTAPTCKIVSKHGFLKQERRASCFETWAIRR